eukprot:1655757-Prorocentrum_lima.AAC.1
MEGLPWIRGSEPMGCTATPTEQIRVHCVSCPIQDARRNAPGSGWHGRNGKRPPSGTYATQ